LLTAAARAAEPPKCAQIYYDSVPSASPRYLHGRVHALQLQNLLGHFPHIQQIVIPVERYEKGQLGRCAASFYLGTWFDNALPPDFVADFAASTRTAVWAGYNIWQVPPAELERLWSARYRGLSVLDEDDKDPLGRPTFYRLFDYKGRTFEKYGEYDAKRPGRFDAAYEIALLEARRSTTTVVVAWARHNGRAGKRSPYALVGGGAHWYVADSPFSYITEKDRYLIFADLLFDMLGEPPRRRPGEKKPALFRVEDVHPELPAWQLYGMTDMLAKAGAPFSVSVIPMWVDALGALRLPRRWRLSAGDPAFADFLAYAAQRKASFILHGLTHQRGRRRNPYTGISGDDFEFWDRERNRPIEGESDADIEARISDARALLAGAGAYACAWLTPHYQASPRAYRVFARLWDWNVGRAVYFPVADGEPVPEGLPPTGQFYPYEIYGDFYGQRVVPENVGNAQPYMNDQVLKAATIDDMIEVMRRNSVLRDAWASFFVHPSMLDSTAQGGTARRPGDAGELARLVRAARADGYEFVSLSDWTRENLRPIRPEPVEVAP
jgi:uncharacterized protein YdaL